MPTTNDPQHMQLILWAVLSVVGVLLGLLGWSLRSQLRGLEEGIASIAGDLRQLAARVGNHETSLAQGNVKFSELERRVNGLEDRERQRFFNGPRSALGGE
jgi:hypothetical protein